MKFKIGDLVCDVVVRPPGFAITEHKVINGESHYLLAGKDFWFPERILMKYENN